MHYNDFDKKKCTNDNDNERKIMMMILQGNPSEQISMGKLRSSLGKEGDQD